MSFTSKNGSIGSQVYESLTRASRRRQDKAWKEYRTSSGFVSLDDYYSIELMETSYRQAVYDTLKKLDDLSYETWSKVYDFNV